MSDQRKKNPSLSRKVNIPTVPIVPKKSKNSHDDDDAKIMNQRIKTELPPPNSFYYGFTVQQQRAIQIKSRQSQREKSFTNKSDKEPKIGNFRRKNQTSNPKITIVPVESPKKIQRQLIYNRGHIGQLINDTKSKTNQQTISQLKRWKERQLYKGYKYNQQQQINEGLKHIRIYKEYMQRKNQQKQQKKYLNKKQQPKQVQLSKYDQLPKQIKPNKSKERKFSIRSYYNKKVLQLEKKKKSNSPKKRKEKTNSPEKSEKRKVIYTNTDVVIQRSTKVQENDETYYLKPKINQKQKQEQKKSINKDRKKN